MAHEIFSTQMMLTENVVGKAGLGKGVNSFSQIGVFSGVLRCGGEQLLSPVEKTDASKAWEPRSSPEFWL